MIFWKTGRGKEKLGEGTSFTGWVGGGGLTYGARTYKASPDKAFGLGLFLRVARWRASLGRGRILARVHCPLLEKRTLHNKDMCPGKLKH